MKNFFLIVLITFTVLSAQEQSIDLSLKESLNAEQQKQRKDIDILKNQIEEIHNQNKALEAEVRRLKSNTMFLQNNRFTQSRLVMYFEHRIYTIPISSQSMSVFLTNVDIHQKIWRLT